MTPTPTGWNRIVARLRGEIPAAALEAYRRASLSVLELFEQVERPLRERLLFGLAARPEDAAVEKLARVAREDEEPDASLRRTALYWLRVSRHPRARELLAGMAPRREARTREPE
jgi:hypothetical protein